jgi:hypothetical protein
LLSLVNLVVLCLSLLLSECLGLNDWDGHGIGGEPLGEVSTLLVHWLLLISGNTVVFLVIEVSGEVVHAELNVLLDNWDASVVVDQIGGVRALRFFMVFLEVMARKLTVSGVMHLFSMLEDSGFVECVEFLGSHLDVILNSVTILISDFTHHVNIGGGNVAKLVTDHLRLELDS